MIAQPLIKDLFLDGASFLVDEHPVAELRMPAEAMPAEADSVLAAEIGHPVGFLKVPDAFRRMDFPGFHHVFRRDAVEFPDNELLLSGLFDIVRIDGNAHHEIIPVGFFQPLCPDSGGAREHEHQPYDQFLHC